MDLSDFLKDVFMFKNIDNDTLNKIVLSISPEVKEYEHKVKIYTPSDYERKIGFVIKGECYIERIKSDGTSVLLNTVKEYDSFGIMSVLSSEDEFPTAITASRFSKILFISQNDFFKLINEFPTVSRNVIEFLAKKILFLNKKVATFSSDTVEKKLASYLYIEYQKQGREFSFNCKKSAEAINSGRASLYRALNSLEEEKIIMLENKKINILDPKGLERISK